MKTYKFSVIASRAITVEAEDRYDAIKKATAAAQELANRGRFVVEEIEIEREWEDEQP